MRRLHFVRATEARSNSRRIHATATAGDAGQVSFAHVAAIVVTLSFSSGVSLRIARSSRRS
jgi:hypothetical protein